MGSHHIARIELHVENGMKFSMFQYVYSCVRVYVCVRAPSKNAIISKQLNEARV